MKSDSSSNPKSPAWARRVSALLGAYAAVGGMVSLLGWVFDIYRLTDWDGDGIAMKANAAVCATVLGAALVLSQFTLHRKWVIRVPALFVIALAGLTLLQHFWNWDFGIDSLLVGEAPGALATAAPGRMGPPASSSFTLLGIGLALLTGGVRVRRWAARLGIVVGCIAAFSLIGYLYHVSLLFTIPRLTGIALQTASMIAALALGLIISVSEHGWTAALRRDDAGGVALRQMVFPIIILPVALGALRLLGEQAGLYDTRFGVALHVLLTVATLLVLSWWTANDLSRTAQVAAREKHRVTHILASITDGFYVLDATGRFTEFNETARKMFAAQGVDADALIGKHFFDDAFPEARDIPAGRAIQRTLTEQIATEAENLYPPWQRWFNVRNYPTAGGGVATFFQDITERKQAEQQATRELAATRLLNEIGTQCAREENVLEECLDGIVEAAIKLTEADKGNMQLLDESGALKIAAQHGFDESFLKFFARVHDETASACGTAMQSGGRIIIGDVTQSEVFAGQPSLGVLLEAGVRAVQSTPLISSSGKVLGMISTHFAQPHRPGERELRLMDVLARQAADYLERKRAQEVLRDSEAQLIAATSAGSVGTWNWELAPNLLTANPALLQIFSLKSENRGVSPEAFIAAIVPEDQAMVREAIARALGADSKGIYEAEYRVRDTHGKVRWVSARGQVKYDEMRNPVRLPGALTDITERKRSEEQLQRSAELLRVLIDRSPTGFYIVDADFRISHMNADSQARAFRNVNPAIGHRLDVALRVLWPEPLATEMINLFQHTLETGEPYKSPGLVSPRADLKTVETYEWQLARITMADGRPAVVCYYYDTTALREAEQEVRKSRQRFDLVRDGAQVGFWFCDLPFEELIWDNRVKEHFWLAPDARVTIETFYERIHPDDRERTRAAIAESIAGKTRYDIEYRTVSAADGREKWIRAIGRTFYSTEGQPVRFDGVTLDISERKRDEDALRASRAELADANEQLSSRAKQLESLVQQRTAKLTETIGELEGFSYSITHDLRAPLRAVNAFAHILGEEHGGKLDDDGKRLLDRIQQSITRMDKLIQDVLQYSKVLRIDLKLQPVDTEKLVRGMLESYPELQEPRATVIIQGELPHVLANEAWLTQCFSNLLHNAVKFVPRERKPQVTVRAEPKDADVRFWIEDNGIGIAPEYQKNLFGLFQRLTNDYEGTGVGLSIVRKAVERMGGTAGVESELDKGSRFWLELRVANNEGKEL